MSNKKYNNLKRYLIVIGIVVLVVIYKNFNPLHFLFPRCPVNMLTGLYCPGCGSQRSLHAIFNFDIQEAFSHNILVTVFVFAFIIDVIFMIFKIEKYRPSYFLKYNKYASRIILYLFIIFTVLRNIPFYPFTILAP